ncbi:MAG: hypothetical protein DMG06_22945, partial [Acidobacteria bacterium]
MPASSARSEYLIKKLGSDLIHTKSQANPQMKTLSLVPYRRRLSMEKHLASLVVAFSFTLSAWSQVKVLTQHNDISRTGANLSETNLTVFNVNVNQFGKLFSRTVDGQIYAQPLYVPNVTVPNKGTHNVIYVASMNNSLYAFDADDPNASAPLWQINLGPPVPYQDTTGYTDINPVIGITSTPVIDPSTNTLYCVAKTRENSNYFQRLHALDLASGQEKFGGPAVIQASVPGTGDGNVNGTVTFSPLRQLNRPGLLLLNGVIYLAFGSHGETFPFHGWVLAYNATTLQRVAVFNSTPNGGLGAIWQSGQGLVADASGYIYLMTGNGSFNYNTGGKNLGMSFVKLSTPALAVVDWFTPYNFSTLNGGDTDLGNSGPLLIPGTNLVLGGGKEGVFHLLNRSNMGHFQAGSNSQIVQNFQVTAGHIHGSPVYWNSPNQGPLVYVWSETDYLKAFKLVNGLFQTTPVATSTMPVPSGMPGAMLSLSANASTAGTGVVWASHPYNADANHATVAGILRAFDASNVTTELWNSKQNASRDDLGNFAKYCPPTVVHGKVYMATFSNRLVVYGLLGGSPANNPPTVNLTSPTQGATFTAPATITLTASASDSDGSVSKVDFYQGTVLLGTDTSSPYSLTWNNVSAGTYSLTAKATDNLGATSTSSSASITVGSGGVSLPTPWAHQDVGSVGVTGTASYSSGTFTIKGSGADIWGSADEFHYVYQPLSGDGQIVARVATQQNTDAWAKAGVMIRETLGASSVHALVAITPGNGSAFQCRPNTGGISTHTVGSTVTAPYWLKLVRSGNSFSAYQSSNGTSWALMGTDT